MIIVLGGIVYFMTVFCLIFNTVIMVLYIIVDS